VNDPIEKTAAVSAAVFAARVGEQTARKLHAQREPIAVWSGLGTIGLIGWSVVVPMLVGAALGIWLDEHHPGRHAWTLALMIGGLGLGCLNAWQWMDREARAIRAGQPR
jgi:ATP synthase protein I